MQASRDQTREKYKKILTLWTARDFTLNRVYLITQFRDLKVSFPVCANCSNLITKDNKERYCIINSSIKSVSINLHFICRNITNVPRNVLNRL